MFLLMSKVEFIEWLEHILNDRGMSRADLARASGLSAPHISRILNGEQSPGNEAIVSIARAINKPPEEVFRRVVGLRPVDPPENEELNYLFDMLPEEAKKEYLQMLRYRAEMEENKSGNKTSRGINRLEVR